MPTYDYKCTQCRHVFEIFQSMSESHISKCPDCGGNVGGLVGGGSGLKYAASQIIYLSKKKDKDGTEIVGNIIHCKTYKSRLTKENQMVDVRLSYTKGLDRYYGLLELAVEADIFKSVSTRIELPDGTKTFGKTINNDPEKYYTEEVMQH